MNLQLTFKQQHSLTVTRVEKHDHLTPVISRPILIYWDRRSKSNPICVWAEASQPLAEQWLKSVVSNSPLLLARLESQICNGCRRRSVRSIVISRKLSTIYRWNTNIIKLALLMLFQQLDPPPDATCRDTVVSNTNYVQILLRPRPPVRLWHQTTAVVNQADRRLTAGVVTCCKQTATPGTCCSQSPSVVYVKVEQEAGSFSPTGRPAEN